MPKSTFFCRGIDIVFPIVSRMLLPSTKRIYIVSKILKDRMIIFGF